MVLRKYWFNFKVLKYNSVSGESVSVSESTSFKHIFLFNTVVFVIATRNQQKNLQKKHMQENFHQDVVFFTTLPLWKWIFFTPSVIFIPVPLMHSFYLYFWPFTFIFPCQFQYAPYISYPFFSHFTSFSLSPFPIFSKLGNCSRLSGTFIISGDSVPATESTSF